MTNEKRLIDAKAGKKLFYAIAKPAEYNGVIHLVVPISEIDKLPTVDAVEVAHGEWTTIEDDYCGLTSMQCSECNQEYWFEDEPPIKIYNYCPNCGAKMDGEGK